MPSKLSKTPTALGLDLGGTRLKYGLINFSGQILREGWIDTQADLGRKKVLENILQVIEIQQNWAKTHDYKFMGVGIGIPGILSHSGILHRSPHFPDWNNYPIQSFFNKKLSCAFVIENDANLAALGEAWLGAAQNKDHFILLTLGTGIGGGIVLNKRLWKGDSGFAGEIGHLVIEKNGRPCPCGGRGCMERYASQTGILQSASDYVQQQGLPPSWKKFEKPISNITSEDLYQLAIHGDRPALHLWEKMGEALGTGLASLVNVMDIETILLGGGLSGAWKFFIPSLRKSLARHTYPTTAKRVKIIRARLGSKAGWIGAARAAIGEK